MVWTTTSGLKGRVYLPDDDSSIPKKHPCNTCFSCQWCEENRCRVCRHDGSKEDMAGLRVNSGR